MDIEADVREMERRKRVEAIMNSKVRIMSKKVKIANQMVSINNKILSIVAKKE